MKENRKEINSRKVSTLVAAVVVLAVVTERPAYGYTDPGSGLLLWQMVGAAFVGSLFYVKRLVSWLSPRRKNTGKADDES